jgi:hypothetical protein
VDAGLPRVECEAHGRIALKLRRRRVKSENQAAEHGLLHMLITNGAGRVALNLGRFMEQLGILKVFG